jgi:hypothetical protein
MFNRVIRRNDRDYFKTRLAAVEGQSGAIDELVAKGILKKEDITAYRNLTPQQKITQRRIIMAEAFMKAKIDDVANADILKRYQVTSRTLLSLVT